MIIAERSLALKLGDRNVEVPVRLTAPFAVGAVWYCTFSIGWPEGERSLRVGGADSMQALVGAIQLLGAELYSSNAHKEGRLSSKDGRSGYGVPVPPNFRRDLIGDDLTYL